MRELTERERLVIDLLGRAAVEQGRLGTLHPSDDGEFVHAVHAAQNIIYARPAYETEKAKWANT